MTDRSTVFRAALLLTLSLLILFSFLGSARLWDRDEPRNARAAQEMLERGDWVVPTFNGELRSHKPVLLYWLQMTAYQFLGQSELSARLPSALAGLLSILAISWLASRLAGERSGLGPTGFWTGAALSTSTLFVMAGRAATPDGCLVGLSTFGIAMIVGGLLVPPGNRSPLAKTLLLPRLGWWWALAGYGALGGALLAKGPVGLVMPLLVIHTWWLLLERPKLEPHQLQTHRLGRMAIRTWSIFHPRQVWRCLLALRTIPGIICAVAIAAPWYIAVSLATDGEFLRDFLWRHNLERAVSSMEGHSGGILFYPAALLVGTFPWSLWLIPILWWAMRAKRRGVVMRTSVTLAGVWVAITVALFTCASTKLPSYITSCYPGVALIVGGFLKDFAADIRMPSRPWRTLAGGIAIAVAFGLASGLIWFSFTEALPLVGWVGCSSFLLALAGVSGWIADWQQRPRLVPAIWLTAAVCLHIGLFGIGTSTVDTYRDEVDMLVSLDAQTEGRGRWFGLGGMEPSWVYYLNQHIEEAPIALATQPERREDWLKFIKAAGARSGDYLIVEGAIAERLTSAVARWSSDDAILVESGRAERFLRPGQIVVYQFVAPTGELATRPDVSTQTIQ